MDRNSPDNVYLNINIRGDDLYDEAASSININKTIPIVNNPSEYYLSVVYAKIPLNNIPITIAIPIPNQPDSDLLKIGIGVRYMGVEYFENVRYVTQQQTPQPVQNRKRSIINTYYFVYTVTHMVNMINTALKLAHDNSGAPGTAPYFLFDTNNQKLNLIVDATLVNEYNLGNYSIGFNSDMMTYLEGFSYFEKSMQLVNFKNEIDLYSSGNVCNQYGGEFREIGGTHFLYSQDHYSINKWFCLQKVSIISNTIPIHPEVLGIIPTDTTVNMPILFDIVSNNKLALQERGDIVYNNEGGNRLIDLTSQIPLTNINLNIVWTDMLGNVYPLFTSFFNTIELKLGFHKKSLYNNNVKTH